MDHGHFVFALFTKQEGLARMAKILMLVGIGSLVV